MSAHERERLAAWIDGELATGERAAVEAHLGECEECAALLAELETVDGLARELPLDAPAGYFEAFPARVRSRIEAAGPRRGASRAAWRTPAWTWAAAAALLLGVVTPLTIARLGRDGAPEQAVVVDAKDALAVAEARRAAAPPAVTALEPPRANREQARKPADTVVSSSSPRAAPPAPSELKKELRPAAGEDEEWGGPRASSAEGFASAQLLDRPAAQAQGQTDAPAPAAPGGIVRSPPLVEDVARLESAFEAEAVARDEALSDRDVPTRQMAAAIAAPAEEAPASAAGPGRAGAMNAPLAGAPAKSGQRVESDTGGAAEDVRAFGRLTGHDPETAAAWREHRGDWLLFLEEHPESPLRDEARVRAIEAGIAAWRADGDPADLLLAREDADAYLARDDARQKDRVRNALEAIGER